MQRCSKRLAVLAAGLCLLQGVVSCTIPSVTTPPVTVDVLTPPVYVVPGPVFPPFYPY